MVKAKKLWSKNIWLFLFVLYSLFATITGHDASMEQHVIKQIQVLILGMATNPSIIGLPGTVGYQPSILAKQVHSWGTWHEGGWSQKQNARATGWGSFTCPIFLFQSFGYNFFGKQIGIAKGIFSSFCCLKADPPDFALEYSKSGHEPTNREQHDTWCSEKFLSLTACSHAVFTTKAYTWFKVHCSSFAAAISLRRPLRTFLGLNQMFLIQDFDHNLGWKNIIKDNDIVYRRV